MTMDLGDFGVDPTPDQPSFQKRGRILTRHQNETRTAGWWGVSPNRQSRLFLTERDSHDHRLRHLATDEGGSYAISVSALRKLVGMNVNRVLVVETDRARVLEYPLVEFTDRGGQVPARYLADRADPQRYTTRERAQYVWEVTLRDLLIHRDVSVADPNA